MKLQNHRGFWTTAVLVMASVCLFAFDALSANRGWDGDSSALWTVAANWTNNVGPSAGDNLFYPSGILIPPLSTNNFAAGTAFGRITIAEVAMQAYILGGNRIVLNDGVVYTGNQLSTAPLLALDLTLGADQTFSATRGISFAGRVDINGKTLIVSPTSTGTTFFSGQITNSTGSGHIIKTNAGIMNITATGRASTPPIVVNQGTLRVDGAVTNSSGSAQVSIYEVTGTFTPPTPGTCILVGTGIIDQAYVNDTLSPGNSGPGIIQCKYLVLSGRGCHSFPCTGTPGGYLRAEVNGIIAGTNYDQVTTYGYELDGPSDVSTIYAPANLDLRLGYAAQVGDAFQIIKLLPGNPFGLTNSHMGVFNSLPPNCILDTTNGYSLGVNYSTNGVTLTTLRRPDSPFQLWKGNGIKSGTNYVEQYWSSTNCWAEGVIPASGGKLQFTDYQWRDYSFIPFLGFPVEIISTPPPQTNDIAGLVVASLLFTDTNYVLNGNAITVTEGITNRIDHGTNFCNLDIAVAGSLVLDIDTGSQLVLSNAFAGGGTVTKTGGGEARYSGNTLNSYIGNVAVNNGTMRVNGSITDAGFAVSGGFLCGTGSVGNVTMIGGTLNPGNSPGVLHVEGNLNMSAGATFQVELNGPVANSGYDQLQVNGTVSLTGATLNVQPGYAVPVGAVFLILVNDGSDSITGTFAGLPQGAVFQAGGQYFSISYNSGSGNNDVVLTRVNTPSFPGNFSAVTRQGPHTLRLQGSGGSNVNYTIQANTNLSTTNWIDIGISPSDSLGQFFFDDTNTLSIPMRFFRTKTP